jgi:hypothetical protein
MAAEKTVSLAEFAEGVGLDEDDVLAMLDDVASERAVAAGAAASRASAAASELEELLQAVRAVWGRSSAPREAREVVLDSDLSGHEKLMLLGFLDGVRHGVQVGELVDRKTVAKYRQLATELGLAKLLRRSGLAPLR